MKFTTDRCKNGEVSVTLQVKFEKGNISIPTNIFYCEDIDFENLNRTIINKVINFKISNTGFRSF